MQNESATAMRRTAASGVTDSAPVQARPWWMTALAIFCLGSVVFLIARDLFLPHVRDVEVWLGLELRGPLALLTAPIHWFVFLIGAWGFWFQRPWILPAAAAYEFYIAASHLVWNQTSPNGRGWLAGVLQAVAFSIPAILGLRAHSKATIRKIKINHR
jgi:hypothetical protein